VTTRLAVNRSLALASSSLNDSFLPLSLSLDFGTGGGFDLSGFTSGGGVDLSNAIDDKEIFKLVYK